MKLQSLVGVVTLAARAFGVTYYCKDENGDSVDYWFAIKGVMTTGYLYWDVKHSSLAESKHDLNVTSSGALSETMTQLWSDDDLEYMIFNDEFPDGTKASAGHTKGLEYFLLVYISYYVHLFHYCYVFYF